MSGGALRSSAGSTRIATRGISAVTSGFVRVAASKVSIPTRPNATAAAVARNYGSELIDGWLVDTVDAGAVAEVEAAGIRCRAVPLMMTDVEATAALAREALALAEEVRG